MIQPGVMTPSCFSADIGIIGLDHGRAGGFRYAMEGDSEIVRRLIKLAPEKEAPGARYAVEGRFLGVSLPAARGR